MINKQFKVEGKILDVSRQITQMTTTPTVPKTTCLHQWRGGGGGGGRHNALTAQRKKVHLPREHRTCHTIIITNNKTVIIKLLNYIFYFKAKYRNNILKVWG